MFKRCYNDLCYEQAIGIAIDTLRIDKIYEICTLAISNNYTSILNYTFEICQYTRSIISREFRLNVIKILVDLYYTLPIPDYTNICYALQYLNKPEEVAKVLQTLVSTTDITNDATNDAEKGHNYDPSVYENNILQAYQICFDLKEAENQGFILKIVEAFTPIPTTTTTATNTNNPPQINRSNVPMAATEEEDSTTVDPETVPLLQQADTTATAAATAGNSMNSNACHPITMSTILSYTTILTSYPYILLFLPSLILLYLYTTIYLTIYSTTGPSTTTAAPSSDNNSEYTKHILKIKRILLEGLDIDLTLSFLFKQCHADIHVLKTLKSVTEMGRSSILHNAIVVTHGYMYSG